MLIDNPQDASYYRAASWEGENKPTLGGVKGMRGKLGRVWCWIVAAAVVAVGAQAWAGPKPREISALEAMEMLSAGAKDTFMIDVRTRAEYSLLGHPPKAYNIPWRFLTTDFQVKGGPYAGAKASYTGYQLSPKPNPAFVEVVRSLFKPTDKLILISSRGRLAAEAARKLAAEGFKHLFVVRHGFLGQALVPKEQQELARKYSPYFGRGGRVNGWVYWGLPVSYEVDPRFVYPPDIKRMQLLK